MQYPNNGIELIPIFLFSSHLAQTFDAFSSFLWQKLILHIKDNYPTFPSIAMALIQYDNQYLNTFFHQNYEEYERLLSARRDDQYLDFINNFFDTVFNESKMNKITAFINKEKQYITEIYDLYNHTFVIDCLRQFDSNYETYQNHEKHIIELIKKDKRILSVDNAIADNIPYYLFIIDHLYPLYSNK